MMLDEIKLKNFKCFEELPLSLRRLNVFTGLNGMGKSSVIQALLLLRQSCEQGDNGSKRLLGLTDIRSDLILNGKYTSLGKCRDMIYENAQTDEVEISLREGAASIVLELMCNPDADIVKTNGIMANTLKCLYSGFEYLNAGRVSPMDYYEQSSLSVDIENQIGIYGQYTAQYLANHSSDKVDKTGENIMEYIQNRMNEVSPGIIIEAKNIDGANLSQLSYHYMGADERSVKSNSFRPTNVGFGISYVLPVIVALAKANEGSTLIIENPEAHLHPRGQRKVGEFIAETAERGVQVFVETHSDHILNGIRISVKNKKIHAGDVGLFYFNAEGARHFVETLEIDDNGKLSYWPEGFFDEWDKALDELIV